MAEKLFFLEINIVREKRYGTYEKEYARIWKQREGRKKIEKENNAFYVVYKWPKSSRLNLFLRYEYMLILNSDTNQWNRTFHVIWFGPICKTKGTLSFAGLRIRKALFTK